jgi:hypothetical protein
MGGLYTVFESREFDDASTLLSIEIGGERGQWYVGVKVGDMEKWISPAVWLGRLESAAVAEVDLATKIDFILNNLPQIALAYRNSPRLDEQLYRMTADFGRKLLGEPPMDQTPPDRKSRDQ